MAFDLEKNTHDVSEKPWQERQEQRGHYIFYLSSNFQSIRIDYIMIFSLLKKLLFQTYNCNGIMKVSRNYGPFA